MRITPCGGKAGSVSAGAWNDAVEVLLLLLAPIAPHVAEELWQRRGHDMSVHASPWPQFNEGLAAEDVITLIVQVNNRREPDRVPAMSTDWWNFGGITRSVELVSVPEVFLRADEDVTVV